MRTIAITTGILLLSSLVIGCQENGKRKPTPDPRPVETQILKFGPPPSSALVSAAAASWKTEQIGFEVGGRIKRVAEPNTAIEGHIVVIDEGEVIDDTVEPPVTKKIEYVRNVLFKGTPVAEIENEQYQLQEQIAIAELAQAQQALVAAEIELNESLVAERSVVDAEFTFKKGEFERIERLFNQNRAVPESDYDRADADKKMAAARIKQLEADVRAKEAEVVSLGLKIKQAEQSLRDAERNLRNCTLYSSFRGQIADVSVVPGSIVSAGTPVATIQMMDPIKVELEVSAEQSRVLQNRLMLRVLVPQINGAKPLKENGFVYLVDSVADPQTRTFTVTLLVLNRKATIMIPGGEEIPVTDQAWRLSLPFLPGAEKGLTYVPELAIHHDNVGPFLWRITNMEIGTSLPPNNLLNVQKMRVELGELKLPFLGNWLFQQVNVLDTDFDPSVNLVAGRLQVKSGNPDDWNGDTILVDRSSQWMLRPGDVVQVDVSGRDVEEGFYVPMDAIVRDAGKSFLFVVEETKVTEANPTGQIVKRIEVAIVNETDDATSSLQQIKEFETSLEGLRYVTSGAHYLRDGEPVRAPAADGAAE